MNQLFKQNVHLAFGLFTIFILTSEGKHSQLDTVSNQLEAKYDKGQGNGSYNQTFPYKDQLNVETHVGNIVNRSAGSVKIYQALYTDHSFSTTYIPAYVDSTMTKLVFQAAVERSNPVIMAVTPIGIPARAVLNGFPSAGTVVGTVEVNITAAEYGIWKFTRLDRNIWDVSITGESTVDFSYEIIDNSTGSVITENPLQEKSYRIAVNVPNFSQVKTVDMGMLFSKDSSKPFNMSPLVNKGNGKYEFHDFIKMVNKPFLIGIQGSDNLGHIVRRLSPYAIEPVSLKLLVPPYTGAKLYENIWLDIDFTVVNIVSFEQDIDVRIQDDKGFALAPQFLSATLKPGENVTGHFTLKGGNFNGEIVRVTITARQYLGHGQFASGPSVVRIVTVERSNSTILSSTTTTTVASTRSAVVESTSTSPFSSTEETTSMASTSLAIYASTSSLVPTGLQDVTATTLPGFIQTSDPVTNKQLRVTTNSQPLDTNDTGVFGAHNPITKASSQGIQTNLTTATESPLMSSLKPQSLTITEGNSTVATVFTSAANDNNIFNANTSVAITSTSSPVPTSLQAFAPATLPGLIQTSGLVTNKQLFLNTNDTDLLIAQEPTTFSPQGKQTNLTTATESSLMSSSKPHPVSTIEEKPTLETVSATGAEGNQAVHIGKLEASKKQKQRHASQTMILIKILQGGCAYVDIEDSEEN